VSNIAPGGETTIGLCQSLSCVLLSFPWDSVIICASFLRSFAKTLRTYKRSTNVQEESIEADYPCRLRFRQRFKLILADPGVEDSDRVQHAHAGYHCTPGAQHDRPGPPAAFRTCCGAIGIFVLLVLGFVRG
jgi:hypothetical protein